jgi:hypothetical protein
MIIHLAATFAFSCDMSAAPGAPGMAPGAAPSGAVGVGAVRSGPPRGMPAAAAAAAAACLFMSSSFRASTFRFVASSIAASCTHEQAARVGATRRHCQCGCNRAACQGCAVVRMPSLPPQDTNTGVLQSWKFSHSFTSSMNHAASGGDHFGHGRAVEHVLPRAATNVGHGRRMRNGSAGAYCTSTQTNHLQSFTLSHEMQCLPGQLQKQASTRHTPIPTLCASTAFGCTYSRTTCARAHAHTRAQHTLHKDRHRTWSWARPPPPGRSRFAASPSKSS